MADKLSIKEIEVGKKYNFSKEGCDEHLSIYDGMSEVDEGQGRCVFISETRHVEFVDPVTNQKIRVPTELQAGFNNTDKTYWVRIRMTEADVPKGMSEGEWFIHLTEGQPLKSILSKNKCFTEIVENASAAAQSNSKSRKHRSNRRSRRNRHNRSKRSTRRM